MAKENCWEFLNCGREHGGDRVDELGVCVAALDQTTHGINQGKNGGRLCWAITGTFCGGEVQGTFACKQFSCLVCEFYKKVKKEEGKNFSLMKPGQAYRSDKNCSDEHSIRQDDKGSTDKVNCWEYLNCGREPGGVNALELGVCRAATEETTDKLNSGRNGGRICWAMSGTFCGGEVQGTFAEKQTTCLACDFFTLVRQEEGKGFLLMKPNQVYRRCGRDFRETKKAVL